MATEKGKSVTDWESAVDLSTPVVFYRTLNVDGLEIFYREAGPRDAPTVLLLHGFPSSSHMFRNLYVSLPQTSLDMAKAQHRRSTISTIPTNG